jgi:phosphoribosylanthranilate isomerase
MRDVRVKICGLRTAESVAAACAVGAAYLGFNFFERSPRSVSIAEARDLALGVPPGVAKVALVVDAPDEMLDRIVADVPLDMLQLHGSESPERVRQLRDRHGLPVMKVVGVASSDDLDKLDLYSQFADQILVDAKPPKDAVLPGGNGLTFDWRLISARRWPVPWMLAGGLTPENVGEAIALTGARQVDVASGVESAPGVKDLGKMEAFVTAARG